MKNNSGSTLVGVVAGIVLAGAGYFVIQAINNSPVTPPPPGNTVGIYATPTLTSPAVAAIQGTFECLPHRNPGDFQTLECAYGIKTETGIYFALNMANISPSELDEVNTGSRISVTGNLNESSGGTMWEKYRIEGIIEVTSIEKSP